MRWPAFPVSPGGWKPGAKPPGSRWWTISPTTQPPSESPSPPPASAGLNDGWWWRSNPAPSPPPDAISARPISRPFRAPISCWSPHPFTAAVLPRTRSSIATKLARELESRGVPSLMPGPGRRRGRGAAAASRARRCCPRLLLRQLRRVSHAVARGTWTIARGRRVMDSPSNASCRSRHAMGGEPGTQL